MPFSKISTITFQLGADKMENAQPSLHVLMAVARMSVRLIIPVALLPNVNQKVKVFPLAHALKATLVILISSVSLQGALKIQNAPVTSTASTNSVRMPVLRGNVLPILSVAFQTT